MTQRPINFPFLTSLFRSIVQHSGGGGGAGNKATGREDDRSPPSSAEVKNTWHHTSNLPYVFMAC